MKENFDSFEDTKESLKGVDAFLCTLGTRVNTGDANFRKVDFEYPLQFAILARELDGGRLEFMATLQEN